MKEEKIYYPWVFWINVEKREWFKRFWKSRGANSLHIQFFSLHISLGMPWNQQVLRSAVVNYPLEGFDNFKKTNATFTKWNHIHIGSYNDIRNLPWKILQWSHKI
jgi:hypothetical protein